MKIGMVSEFYYPHPGGISEHIRCLSRELARRGHDVVVITGSMPPGGMEPGPRTVRLGRSVPLRYNAGLSRVTVGRRLGAALRRTLREERCDLLHVHNPLMPVLPLLALEAAESPVVATLHSGYPRDRLAELFRRPLQRRLERASFLLPVSHAAWRAVEGIFDRPWRIVPNGVDAAFFAPDRIGSTGAPPTGAPRPSSLHLGVPDPGLPDPGVPRPGLPDLGLPDPGVPDPGLPDLGLSQPGLPDPGEPLPDARRSGIPLPDVRRSGERLSDVWLPDARVPDARLDHAHLPGARRPSRILFAGAVVPRKGLDVMLAAFDLVCARRGDVELWVAGDGPLLPRLRRAQRTRSARLTRYLGHCGREALRTALHAADLFCAPSLGRESFGMVLLEAMAAGVPVVASAIPGYDEVVEPGRDGLLVPPGDPARLATAIERLLDDAPARARLRAAGRAKAAEYAWLRIAERVEEIYLEALGVVPARRAGGGREDQLPAGRSPVRKFSSVCPSS